MARFSHKLVKIHFKTAFSQPKHVVFKASPFRFTTYNVVYSSPNGAVYARDKLNGFEYPPGHRVSVKLVEDHPHGPRGGGRGRGIAHGGGPIQSADIVSLTETIATATAYLQVETRKEIRNADNLGDVF